MEENVFEKYKLMRYSIQLKDVRLISLNCNNHVIDNKEDFSKKISIRMHREIKLISSEEIEIFLRILVDFKDENGPFTVDVTYAGICKAIKELSETDFKEYAYEQVVPLLLPYIRECVSNTISRMRLPIFYLPTIDVLQTFEVNQIRQ
ncbi:protein-export chaperone SecB [Bacillus cereus]